MSTGIDAPRGTSRRWRNWARTVDFRPAQVRTPRDPSEVAEILATARESGATVKPVGSGHSFTPVAVTDGIQVRLDALAGLWGVDVDPATGTGTATVGAGTTIRDLNDALATRGLGLAVMGDIADQTVAGAISTGTHGTGRDAAGLSAQVSALQIALPDGSIADVSRHRDSALFEAARLGLGALGIITSVSFHVEPAFRLHAVEEPTTLDAVLDAFGDLATAEHAEFYWLPFTDVVQLKRNHRTEDPARPLHRVRAWWEGEVVENLGVDAIQRLTRAAPKLTPPVNRAAARLVNRRDYVDTAPAVFTSIRRVRFHEMEYALPREVAVPALRRFRDLTVEGPWRIAFPVEVRLAPADDVWLSTAHGRDTVYIATHAYPRTEYRAWFDAVESLWQEYDGRPHWGKLHTCDAATLAARYPRMADFRAVRDRVDPARTMGNAHLDHVLGR